jgi:glutaminyl-peptide cyclotransferase
MHCQDTGSIKNQSAIRRGWPIAPRLACVLVAVVCTVVGCIGRDLSFDGEKAYSHVLKQCAFGPRPVGSDENRQTAEYISSTLEKLGWAVQMQEFAYRGVTVRNVIASRGSGPLIVLGAHYDTRSVADRDPIDPTQPVPGADDGASGVAVLLELGRALDPDEVPFEVWLVFFDGEDQGAIGGWPFSVGASYMAQHLTVKPRAVVVVDMVGDQDQRFLWEANSDADLQHTLWAVAARLGYDDNFVPREGYAIIDDHLPFREQGLVAVDIIDFDYPYWHTVEDTPDKVSPESLERVGRVLETWLESDRSNE